MGPHAILLVLTCCAFLPAPTASAGEDRSPSVVRRGVFMGLDPGLALRLDDQGKSLYARMDMRIGGCFNRWLQLGLDWRGDILVTGEEADFQRRYEIGPVLTFFMHKGWFSRAFVHVGDFSPFTLTGGVQTGYEFSTGRFTGVGFAAGGDVDVPLNGDPPSGYSVSLVLYLTAYDLGNRRGRDF